MMDSETRKQILDFCLSDNVVCGNESLKDDSEIVMDYAQRHGLCMDIKANKKAQGSFCANVPQKPQNLAPDSYEGQENLNHLCNDEYFIRDAVYAHVADNPNIIPTTCQKTVTDSSDKYGKNFLSNYTLVNSMWSGDDSLPDSMVPGGNGEGLKTSELVRKIIAEHVCKELTEDENCTKLKSILSTEATNKAAMIEQKEKDDLISSDIMKCEKQCLDQGLSYDDYENFELCVNPCLQTKHPNVFGGLNTTGGVAMPPEGMMEGMTPPDGTMASSAGKDMNFNMDEFMKAFKDDHDDESTSYSEGDESTSYSEGDESTSSYSEGDESTSYSEGDESTSFSEDEMPSQECQGDAWQTSWACWFKRGCHNPYVAGICEDSEYNIITPPSDELPQPASCPNLQSACDVDLDESSQCLQAIREEYGEDIVDCGQISWYEYFERGCHVDPTECGKEFLENLQSPANMWSLNTYTFSTDACKTNIQDICAQDAETVDTCLREYGDWLGLSGLSCT